MYLPNDRLRKLSTNRKKYFEARLLKRPATQQWLVPEDAPQELVQAVIDEMREAGCGWCQKHDAWHEIQLETWSYRDKAFSACPVPVLHPSDLKAGGEGNPGGEQKDTGNWQGLPGESGEGEKEDERIYDRDAGEENCGFDMHSSFICTRIKGHSGDHVAHVTNGTKQGREVGRQKQEGEQQQKKQLKAQKWKMRHFNRCPSCKIDTLNTTLQPAPEPEPEKQIVYTESQCGCEKLKELGF